MDQSTGVAKRTNQFKKMIMELRHEMPPLLPVRVYVREKVGDGWLGCTYLRFKDDKPSHFVIEIKKCHNQIMRDTLMHEWAHAIAWRENHATVCDHDPEWALAYSRVYQLVVGA